MRNLTKRDGTWYLRRMVDGKEIWRSLETSDASIARARRDDLLKMMAGGKWAEIDGMRKRRPAASIGQVIERFMSATDLQLAQRTKEDYVWALRRVLKKALDRNEVDGLQASVLTRDLARAWQQTSIGTTCQDKLKADSAAVTANSMLSQARSLFSKRAMEARDIYKGMLLPDLTGFLKAPLLRVLKRDYYEKPPEAVLRRAWLAAQLLAQPIPGPVRAKDEARRRGLWIIFRLALQAGLRRAEIMGMRWHWLRVSEDGAFVRTCFETDFVPKGKRERNVPIMADLEAELRRVAEAQGWSTAPEDPVLPGAANWKDRVFRQFGEWLDGLGWPRRQKAHELRKVFASDLTEVSDPYDTQQAMGHQDMKTTRLYAARRRVRPVDQAARYGRDLKVLPAA